jgi:hypothetical protein
MPIKLRCRALEIQFFPFYTLFLIRRRKNSICILNLKNPSFAKRVHAIASAIYYHRVIIVFVIIVKDINGMSKPIQRAGLYLLDLLPFLRVFVPDSQIVEDLLVASSTEQH